MSWWEYVQSIAGNVTQREIGDKTGLEPSSIGRWRQSAPRAANVVAFAKAYGRPVIEAFIAAGFLTEEEAGVKPAARPTLDGYTDAELLEELRRRASFRDAVREGIEREPDLRSDSQLKDWLEEVLRHSPQAQRDIMLRVLERSQPEDVIPPSASTPQRTATPSDGGNPQDPPAGAEPDPLWVNYDATRPRTSATEGRDEPPESQ